MFLMGVHWKTDFLPLHFGSGASRRYDYPPRTARYLIRKAFATGQDSKGRGLRKRAGENIRTAKFRDTQPFEFRGTLKAAALGTSNVRATATSNKLQVVVTIPTGHAIPPHLSGHLSRLLDREADSMRRIGFGHVENRLNEFRSPRQQRLAA